MFAPIGLKPSDTCTATLRQIYIYNGIAYVSEPWSIILYFLSIDVSVRSPSVLSVHSEELHRNILCANDLSSQLHLKPKFDHFDAFAMVSDEWFLPLLYSPINNEKLFRLKCDYIENNRFKSE